MTDIGVVHVVDDDEAVRSSLSMLLESAGLTTRTYDSAAAILAAAADLTGGCILSDVRMPEMDGLTLQRHLQDAGCRLPVIIMTGHGDVPVAVQALKAGAADFLEKPFDDERLLKAVGTALDEDRRARAERDHIAEMAAKLHSLTPREREVLTHLVEGHPNKTIAHDLGTSPRTVEVQRARVMQKMGASSLAELVRMVLALQQRGESG
jgi:two-component system response regulator FixJ